MTERSSNTARSCCACASRLSAGHPRACSSRTAERSPCESFALAGARQSKRCWRYRRRIGTRMPARLADRTVCIGPPRPSESYLKVEAIVQAALGTQVRCDPSGLRIPVGARPHWLGSARRKASSSSARRAAADRGGGRQVAGARRGRSGRRPRRAGWRCRSQSCGSGACASTSALPLLVKAVGGGGGRGMKRVDRLEDLPAALELAAVGSRRCVR